jgi:membrane associated rhomboid family serine protease
MAAAIWFAGAVALHHARVRPLRPWLLASVVAVPAQVLISRREPLLVDAAGAVAGVLLYLALHASRKIRLAGMLCVAMIALRGVLPHDSSYHQAFEWTPFRPVLEGDWHTGALAMLAKTILYGSCSWLLHRDGVFSERQAICATVLFLIGLEVLQTGISGRTPESTDPVVALLAGICLHGIPAWNAASTNEPRA